MKSKLCAALGGLALLVNTASPVQAAGRDPGAIAVDVLIARPFCLAATIVGSALFVVSLPVAATSGSTDSVAEALVVKPAWATFNRSLGDFGAMNDYGYAPKKGRIIARSPKHQGEAGKG